MDAQERKAQEQETLQKLEAYFSRLDASGGYLSMKGNHNLDRDDVDVAKCAGIPQADLARLTRAQVKKYCKSIEVPAYNDPKMTKYSRNDNFWIRKKEVRSEDDGRISFVRTRAKRDTHPPGDGVCMSLKDSLQPRWEWTSEQVKERRHSKNFATIRPRTTKPEPLHEIPTNQPRPSKVTRENNMGQIFKQEKQAIQQKADDDLRAVRREIVEIKKTLQREAEEEKEIIQLKAEEEKKALRREAEEEKEVIYLKAEEDKKRMRRDAEEEKKKIQQKAEEERNAMRREAEHKEQDQNRRLCDQNEVNIGLKTEIAVLERKLNCANKKNNQLMDQVKDSGGLHDRRRQTSCSDKLREKLSAIERNSNLQRASLSQMEDERRSLQLKIAELENQIEGNSSREAYMKEQIKNLVDEKSAYFDLNSMLLERINGLGSEYLVPSALEVSSPEPSNAKSEEAVLSEYKPNRPESVCQFQRPLGSMRDDPDVRRLMPLMMMVNGVPPSAIDSTIRDLDAHDHGAHGARFYQKKRTSALPLNSAIIAILYSSADKVSNSNFDGKLISHVEVNTLEMLLRMQDGSTCHVTAGGAPVKRGDADGIAESVTREICSYPNIINALCEIMKENGVDPSQDENWFSSDMRQLGYGALLPDSFPLAKVDVISRDNCATAKSAGKKVGNKVQNSKKDAGVSSSMPSALPTCISSSMPSDVPSSIPSDGPSGVQAISSSGDQSQSAQAPVQNPCHNHHALHWTEIAAVHAFAYLVRRVESDTGRKINADEKRQLNLGTCMRQLMCLMGAGNPYHLNVHDTCLVPFAKENFPDKPLRSTSRVHGGRFYDLFLATINTSINFPIYRAFTSLENRISSNLLELRVYAELRSVYIEMDMLARSIFADQVVVQVLLVFSKGLPRVVTVDEIIPWFALLVSVLENIITEPSSLLTQPRALAHFNDATLTWETQRLKKKIPCARNFGTSTLEGRVIYGDALNVSIYDRDGTSDPLVTELLSQYATGFLFKVKETSEDWIPGGIYATSGLPPALMDPAVGMVNDSAERTLGVQTRINENLAPGIGVSAAQGMTGLTINKFLTKVSDYPTNKLDPEGCFHNAFAAPLQRALIAYACSTSVIADCEAHARSCVDQQKKDKLERTNDKKKAVEQAMKKKRAKEAYAELVFERDICKTLVELDVEKEKHNTEAKAHDFYKRQIILYRDAMRLPEAKKVNFTKTIDGKSTRLDLRGAVEMLMSRASALAWTPQCGSDDHVVEGGGALALASNVTEDYRESMKEGPDFGEECSGVTFLPGRITADAHREREAALSRAAERMKNARIEAAKKLKKENDDSNAKERKRKVKELAQEGKGDPGDMTCAQLKKLLKRSNLATNGAKSDLVSRLQQHMASVPDGAACT